MDRITQPVKYLENIAKMIFVSVDKKNHVMAEPMEPIVSRQIVNVDVLKRCLRAPIWLKATSAMQTIMCADAQKPYQRVLVIVPAKWDNVLVSIYSKLE